MSIVRGANNFNKIYESSKESLFIYTKDNEIHIKTSNDMLIIYRIGYKFEKLFLLHKEDDIDDFIKYMCRHVFFKDFLLDIYFNKSFRYRLPKWFVDNPLIRAIVYKVIYDLYNDNDIYINIKKYYAYKLLYHCFKYPFMDKKIYNLEGFPEKELMEVFNFLKQTSKNNKTFKAIEKEAFFFFLRRYNILKALETISKNKMFAIFKLVILMLPLIFYIIFLILSYLYAKSEWFNNMLTELYAGDISKPILQFIMFGFVLYIFGIVSIHFYHRNINIYNLLMPRLFFGSFIGWTIITNIKQVVDIPMIIHSSFSSYIDLFLAYVFFTLLTLGGVYIYIHSEMKNFIKIFPQGFSIRAFIVLLYSLSVAIFTGLIFIPTLYSAFHLKTVSYDIKVLTYILYASLSSFIAIAVQIIWEPKPITEPE